MTSGCNLLGCIDFLDLEGRFGLESACVIVRTLEEFEGIGAVDDALSYADRLKNVLSAMRGGSQARTAQLAL